MQKFRFDRDGDALPNGSVPIYADWEFGPTLAGVKNCPIQMAGQEIARRIVYVQGDGQVYIGAWDACCRYKQTRRQGTLAIYEDGYILHTAG